MRTLQRQGFLWAKIIAMLCALAGVYYLMSYLKSPDFAKSGNGFSALFNDPNATKASSPVNEAALGQSSSTEGIKAKVVVGGTEQDSTICKVNQGATDANCSTNPSPSASTEASEIKSSEKSPAK